MAEHHRKDTSDRHKTAGIFVRFPPEIDERVRAEADVRDVTPTWLVRRLVIEGLDRLVPVPEFLTKDRSDRDDLL